MLTTFLSDPRKKNALIILALIILGAVSYGNTLQNGFLLDDYIFLIGESTLEDVSFQSLFTWGFKTNYRPLPFSFLKLELQLFQGNPAGYHLVNLSFFIMICYLFYVILNRIVSNDMISFFSVCLFAAHPINNFLVNYKTAVNISIFIVLMQTAFLMFIVFINRKNKVFYFLSMLFYLLSLFSHEIAFILPAYLLVYAYLFRKNTFKKSILWCLPYLIPFMAFLAVRLNVVRAHLMTSALGLDISMSQYLGSLFNLVRWYHAKLFYPKNILFLWDEKIGTQTFTVWMGIVLAAILTVWVLSLWRGKGGGRSYLINHYLIGFLPIPITCFTFTSITGTAMIEPHWLVFSSIGIFCLVVIAIRRIGDYKRFKNVFVMLICLIIAYLAFLTNSSNALWKNDVTYCNYWININPLNGAPHDCRAWAYIKKHDKGTKLGQYKDCTEIADIAGAYHLVTEEDRSIQYYLMALKKDPRCSEAFYGLANFYLDQDDYIMAEGAIRSFLTLNPGSQLGIDQLQRLKAFKSKH